MTIKMYLVKENGDGRTPVTLAGESVAGNRILVELPAGEVVLLTARRDGRVMLGKTGYALAKDVGGVCGLVDRSLAFLR